MNPSLRATGLLLVGLTTGCEPSCEDTCDKLRARLEVHEPVANEEGGEPNEAGSAA